MQLKFVINDPQSIVWMLNGVGVVFLAIPCRHLFRTVAIFFIKFCFNKEEQVSVVFLVKIFSPKSMTFYRAGKLK